MSNDVIARLAAANPVPTGVPLHEPAPLRAPRRRLAVVLAAAVAVLVPTALAVADEIGVSNNGTPVPLDSVPLGPVLEDLQVGGTMQYLGTLNGVAFYATRNADGRYCMAIDHVNEQYQKGVGCDLRPDGFPSTQVRVMTFPAGAQLQGIASDGVATVEALDANGSVLDSTPVVDNLFASTADLGDRVAAIVALDANGSVLSTQELPTKPAG
jgi:hypothetical protein